MEEGSLANIVEGLLKFDRVDVITLKKQMQYAEWIWQLLDQGSNEVEMCAAMQVSQEDLEHLKRGAKDFTIRQIAGLEAVANSLKYKKEE